MHSVGLTAKKCPVLGTHQFFDLANPESCCFGCGWVNDCISRPESADPVRATELERRGWRESYVFPKGSASSPETAETLGGQHYSASHKQVHKFLYLERP